VPDESQCRLLLEGPATWNEWRRRNPNVPINLYNAFLPDAALRNANLAGANLGSAMLNCSDIRNADLTNAQLSGAHLNGAILNDANLAHSRLVGADLTAVQLGNTNLTGAVFGGTIFSADPQDCIGLESLKHESPSVLDITPIINSGEMPPINFLRGCGLSEILIEYLPSLLNKPFDFYSCFISYNHADRPFARRLHDALQGQGIRCWMDEHEILPGDDIYAEVEKGLKWWDKVLLCASEPSLNSWWVEREIDRAFKREMDLTKKRNEPVLSIIPLDLDGYLFQWDHHHASSLQKRLAANFVGWEKDSSIFDDTFQYVLKALTASDSRKEPPPPTKL